MTTDKNLPRVFMYNSVELEDPGPEHDAVDVRNLYSATYPEIVSAAIEGPELKNGKRVYTFRRAVGTKGHGRS
jgi:PRTRC genetic system protein C